MGMSYSDLSVYGTLRKVWKQGPYGMFKTLLNDWSDKFSPQQARHCSFIMLIMYRLLTKSRNSLRIMLLTDIK